MGVDGFVPHSTFWLVRGGSEVVGVSNLRHALIPKLLREGGHIGYGIRPSARGQGLGNEILRLTLGRAVAMGLQEALVTCDKANVASARVIVRNGGTLDSEIFIEERGVMLQRYWIRGLGIGPLGNSESPRESLFGLSIGGHHIVSRDDNGPRITQTLCPRKY